VSWLVDAALVFCVRFKQVEVNEDDGRVKTRALSTGFTVSPLGRPEALLKMPSREFFGVAADPRKEKEGVEMGHVVTNVHLHSPAEHDVAAQDGGEGHLVQRNHAMSDSEVEEPWGRRG
jgi:hypothetical protein